jgi:large subunit ribosomal protein L29
MKVDELRILEADELGVRLKTARRELYELRFKHAVGQLENSSQISKVRHDIARIMTVLRERDFGIAPSVEENAELVAVSSPPAGKSPAKPGDGEGFEPEPVAEEAPKPKRRGRAKKEDSE